MSQGLSGKRTRPVMVFPLRCLQLSEPSGWWTNFLGGQSGEHPPIPPVPASPHLVGLEAPRTTQWSHNSEGVVVPRTKVGRDFVPRFPRYGAFT